MTRLFSTRDIQERYSCGAATARKYIRQMEHQEKPLRVTERALEAWELRRTYSRNETTRKAPIVSTRSPARKTGTGKFLISRTRPA